MKNGEEVGIMNHFLITDKFDLANMPLTMGLKR